ncbi:hypothetical protein SADUNF_Sadunf06G0170700 [Salix dunnii]|uniref:Uncharacterized protein n=1 Tax=Salix dunnii TaxID=1413687 RepID=A0A835K9T4_9ROSI|nr:hypothetical protein SADUNF_Sadunf06G0170700 [Salix dunnii]
MIGKIPEWVTIVYLGRVVSIVFVDNFRVVLEDLGNLWRRRIENRSKEDEIFVLVSMLSSTSFPCLIKQFNETDTIATHDTGYKDHVSQNKQLWSWNGCAGFSIRKLETQINFHDLALPPANLYLVLNHYASARPTMTDQQETSFLSHKMHKGIPHLHSISPKNQLPPQKLRIQIS